MIEIKGQRLHKLDNNLVTFAYPEFPAYIADEL